MQGKTCDSIGCNEYHFYGKNEEEKSPKWEVTEAQEWVLWEMTGGDLNRADGLSERDVGDYQRYDDSGPSRSARQKKEVSKRPLMSHLDVFFCGPGDGGGFDRI